MPAIHKATNRALDHGAAVGIVSSHFRQQLHARARCQYWVQSSN
jgi:hypothetical protein